MTPRYRPFGAFRFGLAMMVLLQHGLLLLAPDDRGVFYSIEMGAVAVTTFFALSGFIVAEAVVTFYDGRPGAFLANRVLRVVPPYLAALALALAVDGLLWRFGRLVPLDAPLVGSPLAPRVILGGVLEIVPGLTARRVSGQDFSFIPFAWTLRVEAMFYLAASAVGAAMAWGGPRRRSRVLGIGLGVAYAIFLIFAWFHRPGDGGPLQVICIPFFAFGLCLFLAGRQTNRAGWAHVGGVACGVALGFTFWGQRGHPVLAYQLPLLAVLFGILTALTRIGAVRPAVQRWDRRLGELSYPLYVSHGVVLSVLAGVSTRRGAVPYGIAVLASLLLASALHRLVERRLQAVRTRLRHSNIGV